MTHLYSHDWLPERRFRRDLAKRLKSVPVQHGWLITIAGGCDGCGLDPEERFSTSFPHEAMESEQVIDGPHRVTWMELG